MFLGWAALYLFLELLLNFGYLVRNFVLRKLLHRFVVVECLEVLNALVVVGCALNDLPYRVHSDGVVQYENDLAKHLKQQIFVQIQCLN